MRVVAEERDLWHGNIFRDSAMLEVEKGRACPGITFKWGNVGVPKILATPKA